MKNILGTLSALLLITFIASCSDNGSGIDPEPEYPIVRGDYTQTDATHAEFTGGSYEKSSTSHTSAIDSTTVTDPVGFGLSFSRDTTFFPDVESIRFEYEEYSAVIDSSVVYDKGITAEWVNPVPDVGIVQQEREFNSDGYVRVAGYITYPCEIKNSEFQDIRIIYLGGETIESREPYRVVTFVTDSLTATLEGVRNCSSS